MPLLLGCIADDFTGATDVASMLVRSGMRTVQSIGLPEAAHAPGDADAVYAALGKTPQCGQCLDDAAMILIEEREQLQSGALIPAN